MGKENLSEWDRQDRGMTKTKSKESHILIEGAILALSRTPQESTRMTTAKTINNSGEGA